MYHLHLNHKSKTPKYKQIVESIITDIERGLLKKNDQLPSISEMSAHYDLARDTVEKAYRELRERGFIVSVQGKGYYVSGGTMASCASCSFLTNSAPTNDSFITPSCKNWANGRRWTSTYTTTTPNCLPTSSNATWANTTTTW